MSKIGILSEFWQFLKYRKKFWLLPIVVVLLLLFGLIILVPPAWAPFVYPL